MTRNRKFHSDWIVMLLHHLIVCLPFLICNFRRRGLFLCLFPILMELSTPLLNLRWFVRTCGYEKSPIFMIVSILFGLTFFFVRILGLIWLCYDNFIVSYAQKALWEMWLYHFVSVGWVVNTLLNMYWFTLIVHGALEPLLSKTPKEKRQ